MTGECVGIVQSDTATGLKSKDKYEMKKIVQFVLEYKVALALALLSIVVLSTSGNLIVAFALLALIAKAV